MRIGFLYRRVRKTYYGGDLGVGSVPNIAGALWEGICEVDEMASRDGASGDFRLGLVEMLAGRTSFNYESLLK
jgi:hypothetical protein